MININKQVKYWITSSESDIDTAKLLIKNQKYLNGLFFCHLAIEKAIKAHVTKSTGQFPPKSHNLILLLEKTDLKIDNQTGTFLGILMKYQLEGRYPDYNPYIPDNKKIEEYFTKTKEIFKWLKNLL